MPALTTIISFSFAFPMLGATASSLCSDTDQCRTIGSIVWPCLVSLFACNYVAIHLNVPKPGLPWYRRLSVKAKVFAVTLLAPEWTFAWSMRQAIWAWRRASQLEEVRAKAVRQWGMAQSTGHAAVNLPYAWQPRNRVGTTSQEWTTTHTFLVIMGGLHVYDRDNKPCYPLDIERVKQLVEHGQLLLPSKEQIEGMSKNDWIGKGFAILQLMWFVLGCIARAADHLPMANLEVMALAHTTVAVATYAPWWPKPLNIEHPFPVSIVSMEELRGALDSERANAVASANTTNAPATANMSANVLPVPLHTSAGRRRSYSIWEIMYAYAFGNQDSLVSLEDRDAVPTFWSDDQDNIFERPRSRRSRDLSSTHTSRRPLEAYWMADVAAMVVIMMFGAVHCVAWPYKTLTVLEQFLWRFSAATIVAVPAVVAIAYVACIFPLACGYEEIVESAMKAVGILAAIAYLVARAILLVISFVSLGSLPLAVYQLGRWSSLLTQF